MYHVYGLGANSDGCLGLGHNNTIPSPELIPQLCHQSIHYFSNGCDFVLAMNGNCIYGFGDNRWGQLARGKQSYFYTMFKNTAECVTPAIIQYFVGINIAQLCCGNDHCLALTGDGRVYGWGRNYWGQIGCNDSDCEYSGGQTFRSIPYELQFGGNYKIRDIYCCHWSSYAITTDGQVFSWGDNREQRLGHNIRDKKAMDSEKQNDNNSLSGDKSSDGNYKRYFIEVSAVGTGGFGTVFQVKHRLDDKIYAVKRVQFEGFSEEKKNRIMNEVKSLVKLDSDFVVKYYHSWLENNHLYIQMEYCSQSLKTILVDKLIVFGRQPEDPMKVFEYFLCCEIFKELLECVQYLHESCPPDIHRDLKPANILVLQNNANKRFVKLCDFGLATDHDMTSMSHTTNVGTSQFMAPEIYQSHYTVKVDIYSLGVIAYHLFDLFNIENPIEKYSLTQFSDNFDKLHEMIASMFQSMADNRPTSGQVLEDYNHWSKVVVNEKNDSKLNRLGYYKAQFIELNTIGAGNFGKVYRVQHRLDAKIYAVKKVQFDDYTKNLFISETKIIAKVHSDFVVKHHNLWSEGQYLYIQMDYCPQTLSSILRWRRDLLGRQPAEPMNVFEYYISCEIFRDLLECLQYIHELTPPVIHRDLRPENIRISYNNSSNNRFLKLGAFSLATSIGRPNNAVNLQYIAPETYRSIYTIKVDIYSLGVIAHNLFDIFNMANVTKIYNLTAFPANYNKLCETILSMIEYTDTKRPTSSRVLEDYSQWSIDNAVQSDHDAIVEFYFNNQFTEILHISSGSFGTVFKVKQKFDNKIYAVKKVQFDDFSEENKHKIMNEVKSLEKLDSDFVVKYYNSWLECNHLYIQMEYCSQSLRSILTDKPIVFGREPEDPIKVFEYFICCEIFKELLECVQYLHESCPPVIHRDLKPDNILISQNKGINDRFVKLCDFGLATNHEMTSMSHTGNVGTSQYMAPEVYQSRYTIKVDIYSLATSGRQVAEYYMTITTGLLIMLITGSSSGIGAATAVQFAKAGAQVVVTGRTNNLPTDTAKQCLEVSPKGIQALEVTADVTKREDMRRLVDQTIKHFGKLDIVVNNAGAAISTTIDDIDYYDKFEKVIAINLNSAVYLTHICVEYLAKTNGNIINISSVTAKRASVSMSPYCMSKCALDMFTRCMAAELAPKGIRVNVLKVVFLESENSIKLA
ncbi:unnamed protein product [Medioppia subpectinata]|uniref:Protein kinase domain-containing protein n=1 Tax=Medioppia subpectinata TaxID=1979941 RepID=A0A7R9PT92_9ACAR|nr:unnamed protein product [Medioppia subpectinata]CAG2100258.1 unnamed protein product [Medioppia subpectinata]